MRVIYVSAKPETTQTLIFMHARIQNYSSGCWYFKFRFVNGIFNEAYNNLPLQMFIIYFLQFPEELHKSSET